MFRTVPLHIIRSFSLYTQQWYMSYRFADSLRAAVSKPVWHTPLLCVKWKTPGDVQSNCPKHVEFYSKNKFEKLVHLIGFVISIILFYSLLFNTISVSTKVFLLSPVCTVYHDKDEAFVQNKLVLSARKRTGVLLHCMTVEWCVRDWVHNSHKFRSGPKFWFIGSLVQACVTFTYNTCTWASPIEWGQFDTRFNWYIYNKLKLKLSCTNFSFVIKFMFVPLRYTNACKDSREIL